MDIKDTEVPGTITLSIDPANFKDAKGKPASLDGKPTWDVQPDQTILTKVSESDDGYSATFHLTDDLGAAQAIVTGDARQGPDTVPITSVFLFNITPGDVATLGDVTASAITPDP